MAHETPARSIVIIGGGIIGSSIAYYLTRHPLIGDTAIHLLEASSIAAGASGKGGGFLASDWHDRGTASLAKLSFDLHEQLANEHDGGRIWGYRRLTTLDVKVNSSQARHKNVPGAESWLGNVTSAMNIGQEQNTAQAHPYHFTKTILSAAQGRGVVVHLAAADGLRFADDGMTLVGVTATGNEDGKHIELSATDVVFAAGPWTGDLAKELLKERAGAAAGIVPSKRATSIVLRPEKPITPHALFLEVDPIPASALHCSPEVYPRPDGTVYVCGISAREAAVPLPQRASAVVHSEKSAKLLREHIEMIAPEAFGPGTSVEVVAEQACYLPESSETGAPVIGEIEKGIWMASGHSVWGILMGRSLTGNVQHISFYDLANELGTAIGTLARLVTAPGTGKVMAELLLDGRAISADISRLAP